MSSNQTSDLKHLTSDLSPDNELLAETLLSKDFDWQSPTLRNYVYSHEFMDSIKAQLKAENITCVYSGSIIDGLSLLKPSPDLDTMYILDKLVVHPLQHQRDEGLIAIPTMDIGFYKVEVKTMPENVISIYGEDMSSFVVTHDGIKYLSSEKWADSTLQSSQDYGLLTNELESIGAVRTGPAVNVDYKEQATNIQNFAKEEEEFYAENPDLLEVFCPSDYNADRVIGLAFTSWPDEARGFLKRTRKWPSSQTMQQLEKCRLYLVCAGHHLSEDKGLQFRLSFSALEVLLAKDLTCNQKRCYLWTKAVLKQVFEQKKKVLSSYHLKSLYFRFCETVEPSEFTHRLAQTFLSFLDYCIAALKACNVPNYFIPENNMVSHWKQHDLIEITEQFSAFRNDPIKYMKQCYIPQFHLIFQRAFEVEGTEDEMKYMVNCVLERMHREKLSVLECYMAICDEAGSEEDDTGELVDRMNEQLSW